MARCEDEDDRVSGTQVSTAEAPFFRIKRDDDFLGLAWLVSCVCVRTLLVRARLRFFLFHSVYYLSARFLGHCFTR